MLQKSGYALLAAFGLSAALTIILKLTNAVHFLMSKVLIALLWAVSLGGSVLFILALFNHSVHKRDADSNDDWIGQDFI